VVFLYKRDVFLIIIEKIKLQNFKKFQKLDVEINKDFNIFIGDNETGKSTILFALDIVLSGSKSKIENAGIEHLFNKNTIAEYLNTEKNYSDLPKLFIEIYINKQDTEDLNGDNNSDDKNADGLKLIIEPDESYINEIINILKNENANFPFEFYKCEFTTFQGRPYSGYKKYINYIFVDNSRTGSEYAMKEYIYNMYNSYAENAERFEHLNKYRKTKDDFNKENLKELNAKVPNGKFGVKNDSKSNMISDLTIFEEDVAIENKGKGRQCFIKTQFAIGKARNNIDVVLIEEPENHLSQHHMQMLINQIASVKDRQLFIATHNNLISARLDLRNIIMLSNIKTVPLPFKLLNEDTAKYFMKASDHNILEYIMASKVILVEGDAEYMLMSKMFEIVTKENVSKRNVSIIAVNGISFKRYLDLAKLMKTKTAVIRDNDRDYKKNCIDNYSDYKEDYIAIFGDNDPMRYTFEVCLYLDNKSICDELFSKNRKTLSPQDYMLKNKTEAAYTLMASDTEITVPEYIKKAIEWIKK
jgi:predicted ATP-dependent endonuclease of OLD family